MVEGRLWSKAGIPLWESPCGNPLAGHLHRFIYDGSQISKHGFFIWEVVKAHVATSPTDQEPVHYRGEGVFMISGRNISRRSHFKAQNL